MFWIDDQTIESSGLDGKSKSTIVKAGSSNFNGITLDLTKRTVYVLETGSGKLISYNYDGSNKRVLFYSKNHRMASGLTLDGNMIYWIKNWTQLYYMEDMKNKTVTRKKLTVSFSSKLKSHTLLEINFFYISNATAFVRFFY